MGVQRWADIKHKAKPMAGSVAANTSGSDPADPGPSPGRPTLYVKTPPLRFRDRPTLRLDARGQMKAVEHIEEGERGAKEMPRCYDEYHRYWNEAWR